MEDNWIFRRSVAAFLRYRGFNVIEEGDGASALHRLESGPRPCVIVTDLALPVMDGWKLLERRAARPEWADIPVIVVSGAPEVIRTDPRFAGVDVLAKPLDFVFFLQRLEAVATLDD